MGAERGARAEIAKPAQVAGSSDTTVAVVSQHPSVSQTLTNVSRSGVKRQPRVLDIYAQFPAPESSGPLAARGPLPRYSQAPTSNLSVTPDLSVLDIHPQAFLSTTSATPTSCATGRTLRCTSTRRRCGACMRPHSHIDAGACDCPNSHAYRDGVGVGVGVKTRCCALNPVLLCPLSATVTQCTLVGASETAAAFTPSPS